MDNFKKLQEELPSITQKVRLADESINLEKLTDEEKQLAFLRLVLLKDATISIIEKLQADLNRNVGVYVRTPAVATTTVFYGNMDIVKAMLDAVIGDSCNAPEEGGDASVKNKVDGEK